jgi:hypothetical protein
MHRPAERLISLPVVIVNVNDDAAHGGRQIIGRPDSIVSVQERLGVAEGIRVDQHLVAVESKPLAVEILGPIDTVSVMSAWSEAVDMDVPEKESLVDSGLQLNDLDWLDVVMLVEKKQLDGSGIPGEDREIHSFLIDSSTEGMGSASLRLERSRRFLLPNIGFPLRDCNGGWHVEVSHQDRRGPLMIVPSLE